MISGTDAGVLIAGAGIAGLTTALSLHAAGVECVVVDKARELTTAGVGINLLPHAVRELTELGFGDELAALGVPTAEMIHYDRFGNQIWCEPRGIAAGYRWPQYSIHRGELQLMLLRAVTERLGVDAVRTGVALSRFADTGDGVRVHLLDRRTGELGSWDGDALIGADGLHSAVRAHLHPGEGPPIGSGIRMWRGTAIRQPFLNGRTMIMAGCNTAAKFVAYPISPTVDGLATINWVAEVRRPDAGFAADWTARGRLDDVLPHFADWQFDWLDVPELIRGADSILEYPMVDRDPLAYWGTDRVTLAGDAAHPMYPIGSNGGSQAILDARELAYHLATALDTPAALAGYERARRETVNAIVLANRELGPERILRMVARRAPHGFARIEDVLSEQELAAIGDAYRSTSSSDASTLNTRASWTAPARAADTAALT
ncbi:flavin-dependent oxidoreductase [Nocardia sp. NPDC023852]|uniref:flavin-dependent oxidoreductase n=1 Tax=Nocardia sp. NPDC023852 TaxID=3154697 RepID=UPI0033C443A2